MVAAVRHNESCTKPFYPHIFPGSTGSTGLDTLTIMSLCSNRSQMGWMWGPRFCVWVLADFISLPAVPYLCHQVERSSIALATSPLQQYQGVRPVLLRVPSPTPPPSGPSLRAAQARCGGHSPECCSHRGQGQFSRLPQALTGRHVSPTHVALRQMGNGTALPTYVTLENMHCLSFYSWFILCNTMISISVHFLTKVTSLFSFMIAQSSIRLLSDLRHLSLTCLLSESSPSCLLPKTEILTTVSMEMNLPPL